MHGLVGRGRIRTPERIATVRTRVRRIQPSPVPMPTAARHVQAWQNIDQPDNSKGREHRVKAFLSISGVRLLDLPRDAWGGVYRKRPQESDRHHGRHNDANTKSGQTREKCLIYESR